MGQVLDLLHVFICRGDFVSLVTFFEIGSKPLADMGVLPRKPSDIDWFGPISFVEQALQAFFPNGHELHSQSPQKSIYRIKTDGKQVMLEVENSDANENSSQIYEAMLSERCGSSNYGFVKDHIQVVPASLDWLLFFKESHKFKKDSVHFLKTLNDIKLLHDIGALLPLDSWELLDEREKLTYTNKLPNLNVKKNEFFNPETVNYKYDHDSIHLAVAVYDKPAYNYYKPDESEVYCSEEMFWAVGGDIRLAGVYEEACVLALERSLIPFNFKPNPDKAFATALEKVCTSITSGWFRDYAYSHYHEVWALYHKNGGKAYVTRFQRALEAGKILPFQNNKAMMA